MMQPLVILGGGLAGLAASLVSRAPVYEAHERPGGVALSDQCKGFTFDRGIHVLQTRNPRILTLLDELGVGMTTHRRQAYIYSNGTYTPYPFQVNTAGMPLGLRARCVRDFLRRERDAQPRNYEEWIYASVGSGFAEHFLIPHSEKFWTVHPREMTHEWAGNRVPQPSTLQVLRGAVWSKQTAIGTNAQFSYPAGALGYGAIAAALAREAGPLHPGHRAIRLDVRARTLHFDNGAAVSFERLISTIPLPELVRICTDVPPEVRAAAARLRTNSILVVNLAIGRGGLTEWHWVHFPEKQVSFFRLSFPHNLGHELAPAGTSSISAEVAYSAERPIDAERTVARVVEDLIQVRLLRRDDPILFTTTHDIRYAYCIYDFHRKAAVRLLREWLAQFGIVPAGRYGRWAYFWSDEAMMSGLQTAEQALKAVNDDGAQKVRIAAA